MGAWTVSTSTDVTPVLVEILHTSGLDLLSVPEDKFLLTLRPDSPTSDTSRLCTVLRSRPFSAVG